MQISMCISNQTGKKVVFYPFYNFLTNFLASPCEQFCVKAHTISNTILNKISINPYSKFYTKFALSKSYSYCSFASSSNSVSNCGKILGIKSNELNPLQNPLTVDDKFGKMIGK